MANYISQKEKYDKLPEARKVIKDYYNWQGEKVGVTKKLTCWRETDLGKYLDVCFVCHVTDELKRKCSTLCDISFDANCVPYASEYDSCDPEDEVKMINNWMVYGF